MPQKCDCVDTGSLHMHEVKMRPLGRTTQCSRLLSCKKIQICLIRQKDYTNMKIQRGENHLVQVKEENVGQFRHIPHNNLTWSTPSLRLLASSTMRKHIAVFKPPKETTWLWSLLLLLLSLDTLVLIYDQVLI